MRGSSIYDPAYHPGIGERLRSSGSRGMNYGLERHTNVSSLLPLYTFLVCRTYAAKREETIWGIWMDGDAAFNCTFVVQFHGWLSWKPEEL